MKPTVLGQDLHRLRTAAEEQRLKVIADLANHNFYTKTALARSLAEEPFLQFHPRKIKTIALYYRRLCNGGVERVVAQLSNRFAWEQENGTQNYRVVIVTDEPANREDYEILPQVERVVIPDLRRFPKEDYRIRAQAWHAFLDRYQVDVFLDSGWMEAILFWDMLCIKSHPSHPAFVVHTHGVSSTLYRIPGERVDECFVSYPLADGVVTLSRCDQKYWQCVNPSTYCILNPCHIKPSGVHRAKYGKNILWLGRISQEKQPLEMVRIMEHVVEHVPDAVCHVVGGEDEGLMERLRQAIGEAGLGKHIVLEGFHRDVEAFYQNASVFLVTSAFEGFGLTLYESAAYGLPTVTYDLPWLEYGSIMKGWASVPQLDARGAAQEIVRLLKDPQHWQTQSDGLYHSFEAYYQRDVLSQWQQLFEDLEQGGVPEGVKLDGEYTILLQQIGHMHTLGMQKQREQLEEKLKQTYEEKSELNRKLQKTYEEKAQRGIEIQQLRQQIKQLHHQVEQLGNPGLKGIAKLSLGWVKGKWKI